MPSNNPEGVHFRAYTATGTIAGITVDAVVREEHGYKNDITSFPVQVGSDITDHIRILPETLTITGLMTDTPIGEAASIRPNNYGANVPPDDLPEIATDESRVLNSFSEFLKLAGYSVGDKVQGYFGSTYTLSSSGSNLMTISTSLRTYTDMGLVSIDFPVDANTGRALQFTATFKKVLLSKQRQTSSNLVAPAKTGDQANKVANKKDRGRVETLKTEDTGATKREPTMFLKNAIRGGYQAP